MEENTNLVKENNNNTTKNIEDDIPLSEPFYFKRFNILKFGFFLL